MIAALVLLALSVADVLTTQASLSRGVRETNPLIRPFIVRLGVVPGVLLAKALIIGAVLASCSAIAPEMMQTGVWIIAAFTGAAVVWNLVAMRRSRG